jgi:PPOX class probable F420-dependent enzyme
MYTMSRDEWLSFVSTGTRTGKVAVVRADGTPHIAPVWFVMDSDDTNDYVVFTTANTSVKGRVLRRDNRFAMCVDDENPPFSYVALHAEATISEDLDEMRKWAVLLGARYMGADMGEAIGERNAVPGELLIRGRVTKVTALGGLAD